MQCRKVLLIMAKYASAMPERGLSPIHDIIGESLKKTGLVQSVDTFYSDETSRQVGTDLMGDVLLGWCAANRPDLVVFWPVGWLNIDPLKSTIYTIINTLGIKVYMVRGDSVGPDGDIFNRGWFPFVSFIGFWDATVAHLGYSQNPKAIQAFTTYNPEHFYNRNLERDIDVSFIGSIDRHHRAEYIHFLQEHGVNVATGGGHGGESVSFEEYATIINRSKISLNFCCQNEGYSQLKGRVFHITACKSLLIEDEGIQTKEFFNEGKDFVMCKTKEELLEKARSYLGHHEERERIAESGYKKTTELYNPRNMWAYTLTKMGFEIPHSFVTDKHYQELFAKLESLHESFSK